MSLIMLGGGGEKNMAHVDTLQDADRVHDAQSLNWFHVGHKRYLVSANQPVVPGTASFQFDSSNVTYVNPTDVSFGVTLPAAPGLTIQANGTVITNGATRHNAPGIAPPLNITHQRQGFGTSVSHVIDQTLNGSGLPILNQFGDRTAKFFSGIGIANADANPLVALNHLIPTGGYGIYIAQNNVTGKGIEQILSLPNAHPSNYVGNQFDLTATNNAVNTTAFNINIGGSGAGNKHGLQVTASATGSENFAITGQISNGVGGAGIFGIATTTGYGGYFRGASGAKALLLDGGIESSNIPTTTVGLPIGGWYLRDDGDGFATVRVRLT